MAWQVYRVVFRLRSPLHVGRGKIGNLQRTRLYVPGRTFWGALTMRLTRDAALGKSGATDSAAYQQVGAKVDATLAYTYFYPALWDDSLGDYAVQWPWSPDFTQRFVSSYTGTALTYPSQSVAEGTLHEIELVSPSTLDTGEPVHLVGYVFDDGSSLNWQSALERLQLGGERGYGWGQVTVAALDGPLTNADLFGGVAEFVPNTGTSIRVKANAPSGARVLAHATPDSVKMSGELEPLVGRQWRSNVPSHRYSGEYIEYKGVYFAPGARLDQTDGLFAVGPYGLWSWRVDKT